MKRLPVGGWQLAVGRIPGRTVTTCCLFALFSVSLHAQSVNKLINKGNKLYEKQDYTDAEAEYKKALDKDQNSSVGLFNLGNSMYQQKRFDDAFQQYENSVKRSKDKLSQSAGNYNMGNTFMENKDWQKSIPLFENALKLNPNDNEARYNLAYAQEMLKKQNQQNQQNQNKNQQNKNNKQNNKNQNKNQQNKDNKDQQNPQDKQDQQQQQHPQPMPSKLTKQEAENLLNAVAQQEKQLQDKLDKNKKGVPVAGGKDW